ncbi:AraC family transcriptional regulator [Caballeronia glebae]|jgi:AraC-like DNA-binding protein|uniref:AraC family transcriptional regulator n=1 Tax=Caballeronia glebae TaxID=1777143 RepID=A0A158CGQ1_9BURK|nr:AraC family transcriptional regulator [Caballeronia glebae]SAK81451.1 AraC family transcriptional regulator [Caballeronia glebae]
MAPPPATVPISIVNGFLSGADRAAVVRLAEHSGIPHELLGIPAARVTQEQFSTLYRLLAMELDDEMPGVFARPLRNGTLKFLCLSLLDAPRLEVALHRFGQFFHLILDDFQLVSRRDGPHGTVEFAANPGGPQASALARELMLKLVHGVASWLIREKIPLIEAVFQFQRPPQPSDLLYLFPGPVRFGRDRTLIAFDAAYLDRPIRQRKSDLNAFLQRAPEDWIFVSFTEEVVCHRVRQCIAGGLPTTPTVDAVAQQLHYSVRTLCRRLEAEGTTFQAIKDEVRRDIAIQRLTRSDDALATIAYDVGFDNPTAFHRAFRHWTGSTPAAYRQRTDG